MITKEQIQGALLLASSDEHGIIVEERGELYAIAGLFDLDRLTAFMNVLVEQDRWLLSLPPAGSA